MISRPLRLLAVLVVPLTAGSAQAVPFTLALDPSQSVAEFVNFSGPNFSQSLSGTITIDFDAFPSPSSFEITALSASGGGVSLSLDASNTSAGLAGGGVLLFTTPLFLDAVLPDPDGAGGASAHDTIVGAPPPFGAYTESQDGQSVVGVGLPFSFQLDPEGEWHFTLVAVPEPSSALLLLLASGGLLACRSGEPRSRS